jgi:uncharacterized protein YjbI with pentapeptide repeats
MNIKKTHLFLAMLLSVGSAHGQSVVIDGGSIRVDASSSGKGTATVKGAKSSAGKKSKVVVANDSDDDSDGANVTGGSSVSVGTGGSAINAGSGHGANNGKGRKEYVNSDLSGQNLSRRNYAGASFTNVEAVGTNFNGSDLSKAVMTNVDLSKADLRGANLSGAQMTNVDWNGALFDGATWLDGRRCGPGSTGKCR